MCLEQEKRERLILVYWSQSIVIVELQKYQSKDALCLQAEFFQNKLVETIQFMEVLNLKDSIEKDAFFRKLPTLAEQLPRPIVLKKVNTYFLHMLALKMFACFCALFGPY